jgi:opacity protein-like surface antigen
MRRQMMSVAAVVLCAILLTANAQAQFALGPRAVLTLSTAAYDPGLPPQATSSMKTGYAFGVQFEARIAGPIFTQIEAKYLQGGTIVDISGLVSGSGQPYSAKITAKTVYLEFPVLLKAELMHGSVRPFIIAGPAVGLLLAAKTLTEIVGLTSDEKDTKDGTNSTNISLVGGLGVEFMLGSAVGITADARYSFGLSDMAKAEAGETSHTKIQGRAVLVGVGMMFHL